MRWRAMKKRAKSERWMPLCFYLVALALVVIALLVVAGVAFWLIRRGRKAGAHAWTEATCPACLLLHLVPTGAQLARAD